MANQHQRLVHGWMGWQIRYISIGGGFKYFLFSPLFWEDSHFDYIIFFRWVETTNQICFLLFLAPNHTFDSMTQTTSCHLLCTQLGGKIAKPRGLLGFHFVIRRMLCFFRISKILSNVFKCEFIWYYTYIYIVLPGSMFPCYLHAFPEGSRNHILQSRVLPSPSHAGVWP